MNRLLLEIGRSQRIAVIHELKRCGGMPVKALARRLEMSYMGIKQHCLDLEKDGYLETWRNPKPVGRPELIYRLTKKAQKLFPSASNPISLSLLEAAGRLYGPTAPMKMLLLHFRSQAEACAAKVQGESLPDRVRQLARLREAEGCMSEMQQEPLQIIERHCPMADLIELYPDVANLEREMMERVLGAPVRRVVHSSGEDYECRFFIGT